MSVLWYLVFGVCCAVATAQCPVGWHYNPFGYSCYKFSIDRKSWPAAKKACEFMGSDLATLKTEEEIVYMKGLRMHFGFKDNTWIGGADKKKKSYWTWQTRNGEERITLFDWYPGEPNNYDEVQYCMSLYKVGRDLRMDDDTCEREYFYICEKK